MVLACPSCGFLTVEDEIYGTYIICEICGWEDDQVQLANPCSRGGANLVSLYESQQKAITEIPLEIREHKGIWRSRTWRPLNIQEVQEFTAQTKELQCPNKGIVYESEAYWNQNS